MIEKAFSIETFVPPNWEMHAAHSHLLLRHYDEALTRLHLAVERAPKFTPGHMLLACVYAEMGRLADARETIKTILTISPNRTLAHVPLAHTHRNEDDRNRFLDALRKAGLPEG